jgi:3-phosphoglycerate kinase
MFKTLKEINPKNKRVLVRCDLNSPLDNRQKVTNSFRIEQTIPTIKYLLENENKIILISHLGNPQKLIDQNNASKFSKANFEEKIKNLSLKPVYLKLKELLEKEFNSAKLIRNKTIKFKGIKFLNDCLGKEIERESAKMKTGEILFLENLRFYKGEEKNENVFAKKLSKLAEIYVNDAFGVSHRRHASIIGVPLFLPACAGLLFEKEIKVFSNILKKDSLKRPLIVIIGGAKISNKGVFVGKFLNKADHLLIGGKIANAILSAQGICVKKPYLSPKIMNKINKINLTSTKLHLPIDAIVSPNKIGDKYVRETALGKVKKDELVLDIGNETIKIFSDIIKEAKTIVWAGPLGFFENSLFGNGTKNIAQEIVKNSKAFKIAGGGQTVFALYKFGFKNKFDYVSTGGGAMLKFLCEEKLPGIKALEKSLK